MPGHQIRQTGVRNFNSLGLPCGTGGIDDVRQVRRHRNALRLCVRLGRDLLCISIQRYNLPGAGRQSLC
jgi:hypothetical protein